LPEPALLVISRIYNKTRLPDLFTLPLTKKANTLYFAASFAIIRAFLRNIKKQLALFKAD